MQGSSPHHSSRCPAVNDGTRSYAGGASVLHGSSGVGRSQLPRGGPPPCSGYPYLGQTLSMQVEFMKQQSQFPDSELAWMPQDPKVFESLVGDQCSSSCIPQRGEKRSLNESRDEASEPLARVLRTSDPERPVLVDPYGDSEAIGVGDGVMKIEEF